MKRRTAATYTTSSAPTNDTDKLDEVMEAVEKDSERAARYVTMVRPAMAAARYLRAEHGTRRRTGIDEESPRTEEGAKTMNTSTENEKGDTGDCTLTENDDSSISQARAVRQLAWNQKKRQ